jgi:hypothetical protein
MPPLDHCGRLHGGRFSRYRQPHPWPQAQLVSCGKAGPTSDHHRLGPHPYRQESGRTSPFGPVRSGWRSRAAQPVLPNCSESRSRAAPLGLPRIAYRLSAMDCLLRQVSALNSLASARRS